jgi:hypothetical protein
MTQRPSGIFAQILQGGSRSAVLHCEHARQRTERHRDEPHSHLRSTLFGAVEEIFDDTDPGSRFARCADGNGTMSHLFLSEDEQELARAKATGRPCGLKDTCLIGAMGPHGCAMKFLELAKPP